MIKCPHCGSPRILRLPSTGVVQRIRRLFSNERPHRCSACGWRGLGRKTDGGVAPVFGTVDNPTPNLPGMDSIRARSDKRAAAKANQGAPAAASGEVLAASPTKGPVAAPTAVPDEEAVVPNLRPVSRNRR